MFLQESLRKFVQENIDRIEAGALNSVYSDLPLTMRGKLTDLLIFIDEQPIDKFEVVIPNNAYANNIDIISIEIPSRIVNIQTQAFFRCDNLREVRIPVSVKNIGLKAFAECPNLKFIYYEGTVAEWDEVDLFNNTFCETQVKEIICSDGVVKWEF